MKSVTITIGILFLTWAGVYASALRQLHAERNKR